MLTFGNALKLRRGGAWIGGGATGPVIHVEDFSGYTVGDTVPSGLPSWHKTLYGELDSATVEVGPRLAFNSNNTGGYYSEAAWGGFYGADQELLCRVTPNGYSTDEGVDTVTVVCSARARGNSVSQTFLGVAFRSSDSGPTNVALLNRLASNTTILDSVTLAWTHQTYWVRLQAVGSSARAKVWTINEPEPSSWLLTASGTVTVAVAGVVDFASYPQNSLLVGPLTRRLTVQYVAVAGLDSLADPVIPVPPEFATFPDVVAGIASFDTETFDTATANATHGSWEFDVDQPLVVRGLRHYCATSGEEVPIGLRLWRVSDQALVRFGGVIGVEGEFRDARFEPFTLSTSDAYRVSWQRLDNAARDFGRNFGSISMHPNVTHTGNYFGGDVNTYPATSSGNDYRGPVDILVED